MNVTIKNPEEQEKMRVAGRLAAEVLDMIGPYVVPGVTTEELDRAATTTLSGAARGAGEPQLPRLPEDHLHLGQPRRLPRHPQREAPEGGDFVNIDVTVIRDGFHGDTSRMYFVGKPAVQAQRLARDLLRGHVAGHRGGAARRAPGRYRPRDPELSSRPAIIRWCASTAATASARIYHEDPQVLHYGEPGTGMELRPA